MREINRIARLITEDPDIFNVLETTEAPVKPQAPPRPRPAQPRPFNPPRPKEQPAPKAGGTETETPVKSPSKPKPKPDIRPWNPPRPKEDTTPKAKKAYFFTEDYEDEVSQSTQKFWSELRKAEHTFAKHPVLAMYGQESVRKAFLDNIERLSQAFPKFANMPVQQRLYSVFRKVFLLMSQVSQLESNIRGELEQIAKETVSEVYGVPVDQLEAMLTVDRSQLKSDLLGGGQGNQDEGEYDEDEYDEDEYDEGEYDEDDTPDNTVRDQINKRVTLNILTQGAAVHNMMTIYNLATKKLNKLNPQLVKIYKRLSPGMLSSYWIMDFAAMANLVDLTVGTSSVKYQDNDDGSDPTPIVVAKAKNFPILIQELVKGVMELLSHHGLSGLDQHTTKKVLKSADVLTDEPWLIQVGPHIWRSFLKIVPKGSDLATVVAKLATKEPQFIHDLLSRTIEDLHRDMDPVEQREAIQDMIDEIEEHTGEDYDDIEY